MIQMDNRNFPQLCYYRCGHPVPTTELYEPCTSVLVQTLFILTMVMSILLCVGVRTAAASPLATIDQLFHQSKEYGKYVPPDPAELKKAEELFVRMLQGERGEQITAEWQNLGFHLQKARLDNQTFLALLEYRKNRHGRGFYLFPLKPAAPSILMVPHRFYDLHTGPIGLKHFSTGEFSAAAWNTVHRYKKSTSNSGFLNDDISLPNWDLADLRDSYFTALTRAFSATFPTGHLLQLHGFSKEKRKSWEGRDSDIVLTNGTSSPPEDLIAFADCLKMNVNAMIRVYPIDIRDLGATENISAQLLAGYGHSGFIQMEMCLPMRQKLLKSRELNTVFTHCMQESWR